MANLAVFALDWNKVYGLSTGDERLYGGVCPDSVVELVAAVLELCNAVDDIGVARFCEVYVENLSRYDIGF